MSKITEKELAGFYEYKEFPEGNYKDGLKIVLMKPLDSTYHGTGALFIEKNQELHFITFMNTSGKLSGRKFAYEGESFTIERLSGRGVSYQDEQTGKMITPRVGFVIGKGV